MPHQFVERPAPAFFMAAAGCLVMQTRMGKSELGAVRNPTNIDFPERFSRGILIAFPAPAHRQPGRPYHLEVLAAALMLAAVERAETNPEAAADVHFGLS